MRFPVYFDGDLTQEELAAIFRGTGYVLRSDGAGRLFASRVPKFLERETLRRIASPRLPSQPVERLATAKVRNLG